MLLGFLPRYMLHTLVKWARFQSLDDTVASGQTDRLHHHRHKRALQIVM